MFVEPKPLTRLIARDVMHTPVVTCPPETPLGVVATEMADHRIHCVVTERLTLDRAGTHLAWGVVSDLDLIRGVLTADPAATAGSIAATVPLTVDVEEDVSVVGAALAAYDCSHAIVVEAGAPVGIISTLDLMSALAGEGSPEGSS